MTFTLTSRSFNDGDRLPEAQVFEGMGYCGGNISPPLAWQDPPAGTKSFAITMYDPDAPTGSGWWHWVVINIPASVTSLPAGAGSGDNNLPEHAEMTRTDFGGNVYGGAAPAGAGAPLHLHRPRARYRADRTAERCLGGDGGVCDQPAQPWLGKTYGRVWQEAKITEASGEAFSEKL